MSDDQLYYLIQKQYTHIFKLIISRKTSEARISLAVVKDLWKAAQFNHYEELQRHCDILDKEAVRESRKSFAEEVRITGR